MKPHNMRISILSSGFPMIIQKTSLERFGSMEVIGRISDAVKLIKAELRLHKGRP
jgi:hypothetical protein